MSDASYRFIAGDAARTKIIGVYYLRAGDQAAGQALAETQSGLDSTRVVFNNAIARSRLAVQDNAGQMEVIDGGAPVPSNPIDATGLRAIHNKVVAGTATPRELALYSGILGDRVTGELAITEGLQDETLVLVTTATDDANPYVGIPDVVADGTAATFNISKVDANGDPVVVGVEKVIIRTSNPCKVSVQSVDLQDGEGSFTITSEAGVKGIIEVYVYVADGALNPSDVVELQFS